MASSFIHSTTNVCVKMIHQRIFNRCYQSLSQQYNNVNNCYMMKMTTSKRGYKPLPKPAKPKSGTMASALTSEEIKKMNCFNSNSDTSSSRPMDDGDGDDDTLESDSERKAWRQYVNSKADKDELTEEDLVRRGLMFSNERHGGGKRLLLDQEDDLPIHDFGQEDAMYEIASRPEEFQLDQYRPPIQRNMENKVLNVAVFGTPNVGKSSLVNRLLGRKLSAVSQIVHTTREGILGVYASDKSQVVLKDTPGAITHVYARRLKANPVSPLTTVSWESVMEADLALTIIDCSSISTDFIHERDLRVLEARRYKDTPSVLVINKIDKLTDVVSLLPMIEKLTSPTVETGAPKLFDRVFPISAKKNYGIYQLKQYLLSRAIPGEWEYTPDHTDLSPSRRVEELLREQIYRYFPKEIPYSIVVKTGHWMVRGGALRIGLVVLCPRISMARMFSRNSGALLKVYEEYISKEVANAVNIPVVVTITTKSDIAKLHQHKNFAGR